jgi:hypothetical protein
MPRKAGIYSGIYQVYSYQFSDHSTYIGLTCVPEQRREQHKTGGRVFAKANQLQVQVPEPVVLQDKITSPQLGKEAECHWMDQFEGEGWTLLNVTKDIVLKIAKQFHTTRDWVHFNSGSYAAASKNGWLPECTAHMVKLQKWTKERVAEVASHYISLAKFCKEQASCAVVANRLDIYHEVTAHMTRKCQQPKHKKKSP